MSERPIRDAEGARKALAFFRVMAFVGGHRRCSSSS